MLDMSTLKPLDMREFNKVNSKTLYRSICVPSTVQSYSLCIEYIKNWFLSKFPPETFKSIYVEGKNIYDDFRSLSRIDLLKRQKPTLAITPNISLEFNNENIDSYPYGMDLYTQTGRFKDSFFSYPPNNSYMGIGMETVLMNFNFRIRVETRAQQLDLYKYIKMACRIGFTCGEDVDLDFHIPYSLLIQVARDNGFEVISEKISEGNIKETIVEVPKFLRWLNMNSTLPFLYKHRTLNGNNEFFLRMRKMYVHLRPQDLSADDGEREGQTTNNFGIEFGVEVRFPAPKMYAYYSDNAHKLQTVYGAWAQPNGPISTCYTFKGNVIPDRNRYDWPLYMSTTYEEDENEVMPLNKQLSIEFAELLEGDIGRCIKSCLDQGVSPAIFCDLVFFNGGEYMRGKCDWEKLVFTSDNPARSGSTYIGIYVDGDYLNDYIVTSTDGDKNRISK